MLEAAYENSMSIQATLKGFGVTFRTMLTAPETISYPERKTPVHTRFRGRHRLWKFDNGLEKCVGCSLCAAACPADCIRVVAEENTPDNRVSAGERFARIYEINMSRCIFCGYCEVACPFDAITLEAEYEMSEYNRPRDLVYTKDMLLAPHPKIAPRRPGPRDLMGEQIAFGLAAAGAIGCGVLVVTLGNAFRAAVALIGTLISVAVLFLLQAAPFVAFVQIIVYAGAIVTLFLFVLAYLGERVQGSPDRLARYEVFTWIVILALSGMIGIVLLSSELPGIGDEPRPVDDIGSPQAIGESFLREHLLPFEVTSLVLLVAAVGAVLLAKRAVLAERGR